jgi:hypothetical protein
MTDSASTGEAFVSIDFDIWFPHKFWVSDWVADDAYPDGFRYKILSVRNEKESYVNLVLIMQQRNGEKIERTNIDINLSGFDGYVNSFIPGLEETFGIDFQEFDMTAIRDDTAYEEFCHQNGWESRVV